MPVGAQLDGVLGGWGGVFVGREEYDGDIFGLRGGQDQQSLILLSLSQYGQCCTGWLLPAE